MTREDATRITDALLSELEGRAGIGDQIDIIRDDREVWDEMHACLVQTVLDAQLASWSAWPAGAATGPCDDQDCRIRDCINPKISVGETDSGPLVVVVWVTKSNEEFIRIDGVTLPLGVEADWQRAMSLLREKHGDMAPMTLSYIPRQTMKPGEP